MSDISKPILTDSETLEMLNGFYAEAMQFLGVPKAAWAEMRIGVVFGEDGKADVTPYIDYANARILVCLSSQCELPRNGLTASVIRKPPFPLHQTFIRHPGIEPFLVFSLQN